MPQFDNPKDDWKKRPEHKQEDLSVSTTDINDHLPNKSNIDSPKTGENEDGDNIDSYSEDLFQEAKSDLGNELPDKVFERKYLEINDVFKEVFDKKSSFSQSIFVFLRGKLIQYDLFDKYDEVVILQEVYSRVITQIKEGREIANAHAWICSVGLRYIRELSGYHRQNINIDDPLFEILALNEDLDEEWFPEELLNVRRTFQSLSQEERELLNLRVIEKLSWEAIREILIKKGHGDVSLDSLRQRKSRILSRLRNVYHRLEVD